LAAVTDEPGRTSAAAAGQRIQAIIEAAERSAEEIEREARAEAERIRADARRDADQVNTRGREAAERLALRAQELERELADLGDAARASIAALAEEARRAAARLAEEPAPPAPDEDVPGPEEVLGEEAASVAAQPDADDPIIAEAEALAAPAPDPGGGRNEGARLIALNMALSGTPREETERYLNENFEIEDVDGMLDDVYARAG
jgi:hypothetical protein